MGPAFGQREAANQRRPRLRWRPAGAGKPSKKRTDHEQPPWAVPGPTLPPTIPSRQPAHGLAEAQARPCGPRPGGFRRLLPMPPRACGACPWCRPRSNHALLGPLVGLLTPGPTLSPSHVRPAHVTWGERNAMASMTTVVLPGHSGGAVPELHRSSLLSPPSPAAAAGHQRLGVENRGGADPVNEPGDGHTTRSACQPGARPREAVPKGPGCASHCAGWRASDRKVYPFETACKVSPTVTTSP